MVTGRGKAVPPVPSIGPWLTVWPCSGEEAPGGCPGGACSGACPPSPPLVWILTLSFSSSRAVAGVSLHLVNAGRHRCHRHLNICRADRVRDEFHLPRFAIRARVAASGAYCRPPGWGCVGDRPLLRASVSGVSGVGFCVDMPRAPLRCARDRAQGASPCASSPALFLYVLLGDRASLGGSGPC